MRAVTADSLCPCPAEGTSDSSQCALCYLLRGRAKACTEGLFSAFRGFAIFFLLEALIAMVEYEIIVNGDRGINGKI